MSNIIKTQIEIAASPEEVRNIFFDFEHWGDIKSDLMRSVTRLPQSSGPIEKGERLSVNFKGITSLVTVLENTETEFKWRGDLLYVISGVHSFRFEASRENPGWTTFHNDELPLRLNALLAKITGSKEFEDFCTGFKARVERVKGAGVTEQGPA
ncbi:hypothetical protein V8E51_000664 [Hyaloscypha variabilis]